MFTAAVETTARVAGERRQAFQLQLADRLRGLSSVDELIGAANALARSHLDVTRAFYVEVDEDAGAFTIPPQWMNNAALPDLPARGHLAAFDPQLLAALAAGEAVVVEDVQGDPRLSPLAGRCDTLGLRALVMVPLVRAGCLRATFNVGDAAPRRWSAQDVTLLADVAERTW